MLKIHPVVDQHGAEKQFNAVFDANLKKQTLQNMQVQQTSEEVGKGKSKSKSTSESSGAILSSTGEHTITSR